jgi:hypothetical protein
MLSVASVTTGAVVCKHLTSRILREEKHQGLHRATPTLLSAHLGLWYEEYLKTRMHRQRPPRETVLEG